MLRTALIVIGKVACGAGCFARNGRPRLAFRHLERSRDCRAHVRAMEIPPKIRAVG